MQHKRLQAAKILTSALLLLSCAFYPAQGKPAGKLILKEQALAATQKAAGTLPRAGSPCPRPRLWRRSRSQSPKR